MRALLLSLCCFYTTLAAAEIDFKTLSMSFEQRVTNEQNQTLKYSGKLWLKQPSFARYDYEKPVKKTIAIANKSVLMIEPDLMQVTRFESEIAVNIIELWKKGKSVGAGKREATINGIKITLEHSGERFDRVYYTDDFDNFVEIVFSNHSRNIAIDDKFFLPPVPKNYDIIRQ
ncbi:outer-membrane lipoprotein carrier protein [Campylobacterota bacterium]|nr:outer-membrane lipoprotein carrier protein [Campylobacterota bacterium]